MTGRLQISERLLDTTFRLLRTCGGGEVECVVVFTARLGSTAVADVVQPDHAASPWHYEVAGPWMTRFFASLRETGRTAVAQVHTHGGRAFHSSTDDQFPLVPEVGFVSLVVPRFAQGPVSLDRMYATVLAANGWQARDPASVLQVISDAG